MGRPHHRCASKAMGKGRQSEALIWREERGISVKVPEVFKKVKKAARKDITMAEVAKHNTRKDAWVCVEGRAYDVTNYVESHPGGWLPISNLAGKDVTDAFANYHPASVYEKLLPNFYLGEIVDYKVSDFVKEHREVRQTLLKEKLFETDMSFYAKYGLWYASLFFGSLFFTILRPSVVEHMIGAALMAAFWQQIA